MTRSHPSAIGAICSFGPRNCWTCLRFSKKPRLKQTARPSRNLKMRSSKPSAVPRRSNPLILPSKPASRSTSPVLGVISPLVSGWRPLRSCPAVNDLPCVWWPCRLRTIPLWCHWMRAIQTKLWRRSKPSRMLRSFPPSAGTAQSATLSTAFGWSGPTVHRRKPWPVSRCWRSWWSCRSGGIQSKRCSRTTCAGGWRRTFSCVVSWRPVSAFMWWRHGCRR